MKYINFKRYKFSTIVKKFDTLRYNFLKIFKFIDLKRYDFRKIYKYLNIRRLNISEVTKYLDFRTYNINRIKKIKFTTSKFLLFHFPASLIFFAFLYLVIPTFYNYDKADMERVLCKNQNIECSIRGEINYSFYPTPRIKIKDLIIKDFFEKKNTLITAKYASIKLSFKNLLAREKHKYKKIQLSNYEINFNLKNSKKYKNIFKKKINLIPITFGKGKILFFDVKEYVATIEDASLNLKFKEDTIEAILVGKFFNDKIYINLNSDKVDDKFLTNIILKLSDLNLLTKANFSNSGEEKNIKNGQVLIKKDNHKITAIFDYKDNELKINKSNLKNNFMDGELKGVITLFPYFNFNLDLNLNSINFTKLYNNFLALDEISQKELFKINNKINGKLNLSTNKIYSSYNLVKSFESRLQFINGNILVDQFLFNLGKIGAADAIGTISNDKKFTNFKFESNIFVDNQKKFLSKFGIHSKKNISPSLFVSGNFDLYNLRSTFYEISDDEKLSNDDLNFVEKEFNYFMLEDGYQSLFRFPKFKNFVKSVSSEIN